MTLKQVFIPGDPYVIRFTAEAAGYGLGFHAHNDWRQYHYTIARHGRVICFSYYWWKLLEIDKPFHFDCSQPHALTTDEAGAIWDNPFEAAFKDLPSAVQTADPAMVYRTDARCDLPIWIADQLREGKTKGQSPMPSFLNEL
jgi:hypothetical protein